MLATVPTRCISIAVGSSVPLARCIRMPTSRCSRTACWAAAIDFGRPIVIGASVFGSSTRLRTGTMMIASSGIGGRVGVGGVLVTVAATRGSHLCEGDDEAAMDIAALDIAILPGRQSQPTLKPALRQLEAMDQGM